MYTKRRFNEWPYGRLLFKVHEPTRKSNWNWSCCHCLSIHYRNLQRVRLIDGTGHLLVSARCVRHRVRARLLMVVSKRIGEVVVVMVATVSGGQRRTTRLQLLLQVQLDLIAVATDFDLHRLQQHKQRRRGLNCVPRWVWRQIDIFTGHRRDRDQIRKQRNNKRRPPPAVCVFDINYCSIILKSLNSFHQDRCRREEGNVKRNSSSVVPLPNC